MGSSQRLDYTGHGPNEMPSHIVAAHTPAPSSKDERRTQKLAETGPKQPQALRDTALNVTEELCQ